MQSGDRHNNSEINTSACFFWYLRQELIRDVMISFVALDEYSSLVKYEVREINIIVQDYLR